MVNLNYLYNPDAARDRFDKNYFVDKKLGFQVIENGTILPYKRTIKGLSNGWVFGGLINSKNEFVRSSLIRYGEGSSYTPPPNQFNTAQRPLFTSACFTTYGGMT